MAEDNRPSLSKDIYGRYETQHAGGAFEVKSVLEAPGMDPVAGRVIDAKSANGQQFQNPNGYEIKVPLLESRYKVVQSNYGSGVSRYANGMDTRRYGSSNPR